MDLHPKFEWNEQHLEMLKKFEVDEPKQKNFMLLVQKGDSILNFQEAVDKFIDATVFIEDGGTHSFEAINRKRIVNG